VAVIFHDVTLAVHRDRHRCAEPRELDLSPVGVSGDHQAHPRRNIRKNIGVVSEQNHRLLGIGLREGAGDIGTGGPKIGDASQPIR
jgi:hypothetical protein